MISGDISDFQIDTSNASIPYRLPGGEVRCPANNDEKEKWIMVLYYINDLFLQLNVFSDMIHLVTLDKENNLRPDNTHIYRSFHSGCNRVVSNTF